MRQNHNSKPRVINIDKSGANKSGIRSINRELLTVKKIKIRQCKYLNNIVEQDHRNIKRRISVLSHLLDKNLKVQLFFNSKRPMT